MLIYCICTQYLVGAPFALKENATVFPYSNMFFPQMTSGYVPLPSQSVHLIALARGTTMLAFSLALFIS